MKYSRTAIGLLTAQYRSVLKKCFLINMGLFALGAVATPANADTIDTRVQITSDTTYTDLTADRIASTTANNGGVFYMEDAQNATLTFNGTTNFTDNSIMNGGMGGAIGNGWLSTKDPSKWSPYTPGGKIVFNGETTFSGNQTNNTNGGGAIFNYGVGTVESPDIIFNEIATFTGNKVTGSSSSVYAGGGAIHTQGGAIVFDGETTFSENTSASKGGAIMTSSTLVFGDDAEFTANEATSTGGAIAILGGDVTFEGTASFSENTAGSGSAISMDQVGSKVTFKDLATFEQNTGTATLWNNSSTGSISFENGATFNQNTNTANGTLQNAAGGEVSVTGGNLSFTNNTGSNGGAIKSSGTVTVDTTGNVLFDTNVTTSSAGAFDNGGTVTIEANKITFNANKANAGYGGAVFNAADMSLLGAENVFTGNTAADTGTTKSGGGAIHNRGNTGLTSLVIGTDNSTNTFSSNVSKAYGGAIVARAVDGNAQNSEVTINGTTEFASNTADLNGGAIWNYVAEKSGTTGTSTFEINGDTTFTGNRASGLGGAIYNNSVMSINGSATFSGNTDSTGANDIYNVGILNLNATSSSDIISLAGGISGDSTNKGTTNIAGNGTVYVANTLTNQNVNNTGNLQLDGADLSGTAITGNGSMEVIGDSSIENTTVQDQTMDVDAGQTLTLTGVTLNETAAGKGTLTNAAGGILDITSSNINVAVNNAGILVSDPTTYTGTVTNTGIATFDNDTFTNTATLNNNGDAYFANSVTYSGANINGIGNLILSSGTTAFATTTTSNDVYVDSGANFTGTLKGNSTTDRYTLDTSNSTIDTISGNAVNADLYIDANLSGTGSADTFAAATGSTIKEINILGNNYGTNGSVTLAVGSGAALDSNVQINGSNYYTDMAVSDGTITLSNKLINSSSLYNELGTWAAGNYVSASDTYNTTTNSYNNVAGHQTVGAAIAALDSGLGAKIAADGNFIKASSTNSVNANISALDTAIGNMSGFAAQNYAKSTTSVAANLTALDTQVKSNADNIANLAVADKGNLVDGSNITAGTIAKAKLATAVQNNLLDNATTSKGLTITDGDATTPANIALNLASAGGLEEDATNGLQLKLKKDGSSNNISGLTTTTDGVSVVAGDSTITVDSTGVKVGTITNSNITDNTISGAKLTDGTVAEAKLATAVQTKLGHAEDAYAAAVTNVTDTVASGNANLITSKGVYANAKNALYGVAGNYTTATDTIGVAIGNLDTAIGNMSGFATQNYAKSTTSVAANLTSLDTALHNTDTIVGPAQTAASGTGQFATRKIGDDINLVNAVDELGRNMVSLGADNTFTGENTFKNTNGIHLQNNVGGNDTNLKATANGLTVDRNVEATGFMIGSNTVTSISVAGSDVSSDAAAMNKMATAATVYGGAQNAQYSGKLVDGTTGVSTIGVALGNTNTQVKSNTDDITTLKAGVGTTGSVLNSIKGNAAGADYSNTTSGLTATTIQGAIDEIDGTVDGIETAITVTADGHYILAANDVKANLGALDSQVYQNTQDIATNAVIGTAATSSAGYAATATVKAAVTAIDGALLNAENKNTVQDTGMGNLASRIGVTYTATDGSVSTTDYAYTNYIADGDSLVTAVGKLDNALKTADSNTAKLDGNNVFTGANTFKNNAGVAIQNTAGTYTATLTATADGLNVAEGISTTSLKLGSNSATAIDVDGSAVATTGSSTLATGATVYNGAENAKYTGSLVKGDTTGTPTINSTLDATIDTLNNVLIADGSKVDSAKVSTSWNGSASDVATALGSGVYGSTNKVAAGDSVTTAITKLDTAIGGAVTGTNGNVLAANSVNANLDKIDVNMGNLTTLKTTAKTSLVGSINEVVDDITVATGTYNKISAGANVAGNLIALDTAIGGVDTKITSVASSIGGTWSGDTFTHSNYNTANKNILNTDNLTTAIGKLDTILGNIAAVANTNGNVGGADVAAKFDTVDSKIGNLTTLGTTAKTSVTSAINEIVTDITVGTGTYNKISAGANVAGNLQALDSAFTDGSIDAKFKSVTIDKAYAITGTTTGELDMGANALKNVKGMELTNGTSDVALTVNSSGNLEADAGIKAASLESTGNLTVGGNATITGTLSAGATTVTSLDAGSGLIKTTGTVQSGSAVTDSLTVGSANAITSTTAGQLNMGANDLTNIKDLTTTGNATVGGTLTAGATTISASGAGTTTALNVTATDTSASGPTTRFTVASDKASVGGNLDVSGTLGVGANAKVAENDAINFLGYGESTPETGQKVLEVSGVDAMAVDGTVAATNGFSVATKSGSTYTEVFGVDDKGSIKSDMLKVDNSSTGNTITLGKNASTATDIKGNLTLNSTGAATDPYVNAIDDGTTAATSAGTNNAHTVATLASVLKSAENADYTVSSSPKNITEATTGSGKTTLHTAIDTLDTEIGADSDYVSTVNGVAGTNSVKTNISNVNAALGDVSTVAVNGYAPTTKNLTDAVTKLNTNMNNVLGGVYKADGSYDASQLAANGFSAAVAPATANLTQSLKDYAVNVETATGGTFSGATWTGSIDGKVDDGTGTSTLVDRTVAYGTISDNNIMDVVDQLYANVGNTAITGVNRAATLAAATTAGTKTVNANIDALDTAIGNLDYTGGSINYALANGSTTDGIKTLVANIGAATTAANGNITSTKSVNANLDQLDTAIGDRSNIGSKNAAINTGTATDVATGLKAAGDAIGDMNFGSTHYVSGTNDLSGAVRSLDDNLYRVETDLRDVKRDLNRGMASMAAMSALVPNPRAHGNTSLAIGTGAYSGHTAAAIGGFHYLTDNIMLNAGAAWGNSRDASYRLGVTFSW